MQRSTSRLILALGLLAGCDGKEDPPPVEDEWAVVQQDLPGALLSVWGTHARDVWAVGADARDGTGPTVLHFDGEAWKRVSTGQAQGDLWWVFGFEGGPVYMGGAGGMILRQDEGSADGAFTLMDTPGTDTVFGIWGASPDEVWAVGGASDSAGGFAWRQRAGVWETESSVPVEVATDAAIWKIYGSSTTDAWAVGSNGVALHWDGAAFTPGQTGIGSSLFTVHASGGRYAAVGGNASGFIVEHDGAQWVDVTPEPAPMGLSGVSLGDDELGVAVGVLGAILVRDASGWRSEDVGFPVRQNLHGSWIDDEGGLWVAGGQTFAPPLTEGLLLHRGAPVPSGGL